MTLIYTELSNGYLSEGGRTIPNDVANRDYALALQQVADLEATITPYAGSGLELVAGKQAKQEAIKAKFLDLHGISLDQASVLQLYFNPLVPATPESNRFHADIAIGAIAIVFVDGLPDIATVNAYDVDNDPGWT